MTKLGKLRSKSGLNKQSKMRFPKQYKLNIRELCCKNYLQQDKKFRRTLERRRTDQREKTKVRIELELSRTTLKECIHLCTEELWK